MNRIKTFIVVLASLSNVSNVRADASLLEWTNHYQSPEVQRTLLSQILPGQIGTVAEARSVPRDAMLLFPKGGLWLKLAPTFATDQTTESPIPTYLVVSVISYQRADRPPISGASYVFRTTRDRGVAITGGYSAEETPYTIVLPKMKRSFLLIESSSPNGSRGKQVTAVLYEVPPSGLDNRPRAVWTSPRSLWDFQYGFDTLGGSREAIVVRGTSGQGNEDYYIYRWDNSRFMRDEMTSEGIVEELPADVWKYGNR